MGLGDSRGRGAKSESTQILITGDPKSQQGFPRVKGVYYDKTKKSWLADFAFQGRRKKIQCGDGSEGYKKAVQIREDFLKTKAKMKIKEVLTG